METIDLKKLIHDVLTGKGPKGSSTLLVAVVLMSILCFGYGAYNAHDYWDLKQNGVFVEGEVVRVEKERSYTSSFANFYPVVRFKDEKGNVHEYRAGRAEEGKYSEGDQDHVYYDANDPKRVVLDELVSYGMRAFLILMGLGGLLCLFILGTVRQVR